MSRKRPAANFTQNKPPQRAREDDSDDDPRWTSDSESEGVLLTFDEALELVAERRAQRPASPAESAVNEGQFDEDDGSDPYWLDEIRFDDQTNPRFDGERHDARHFWFGTLAVPREAANIPELTALNNVSFDYQDIHTMMPESELENVLGRLREPDNWDLPADEYVELLRRQLEFLPPQ